MLFFFKQKTAYEMRISDWSSDVCSSDLPLSAASRSAVANVIRPKALAPNWKRLIERLRQTDRCSGRRTASEWLPDLSKARPTTIPRQSSPGHLTSGPRNRTRVVEGKRVSVSVYLGGHRIIKQKCTASPNRHTPTNEPHIVH